jgi:hypothetical protein
MDASRPECEPLVVFLILKRVLRFYTVILSIDAVHTKQSQRFYKSPRMIHNCIKDTLMLLKNILIEPRNKLSIILGDSTNLREVLNPLQRFSEDR